MDVTDVSTSRIERFADYVRKAAREADYDIDSPRGGGKKKLADDTGMSMTTVSRMLSGERMPDPRYFAPLAKALRIHLNTLLVEAGIVPAETLTREHLQSVSSTPLTPDEVAESWGIHDDAGREIVRTMYERLANRRNTDDRKQEGDAEAQA